jgi:hypothetical protein
MNRQEVAVEIRRIRAELMVILLSDSDIPTQALALIYACVPKVEAGRHLVPMIAELCSRSGDGPRNQGGFQQEDRQ